MPTCVATLEDVVAHARISILATAVLTLVGCIVLPVPTAEWGDAPITREQIDSIEAGIGRLTRSEVIDLIGPPQRRYAGDRVIIYDWTRSQGIWIVGVANQGAIGSGESEHRLCLLFTQEGLLESIEHIDSAIGLSDSKVAALLDEWVGGVAARPLASGLAHNLDVDAFSMTRRDGDSHDTVGILVYSEEESPPPCFNEIDALVTEPYRAFSHQKLRDQFYPWLESPWYEHLEILSTSPLLQRLRQESGLRFVVVVSNDGKFPGQLCSLDAPYTLSCYRVEYVSQLGKIALLDLQQGAVDRAEMQRSIEVPRIPHFPTNGRAVCRILMAYVANDINDRVD